MNIYEAELCRRNYKDFFPEFCSFDYIEDEYHQVLFGLMQRIANGETVRALVDPPPRHMKSESIGRKGIPYLLGKNPKLRIIFSSYSDDLPGKYSRETRKLIKSEKYQEVFPNTQIEYGSDNVKEWNTTEGGAVAWVGVQGGATGRDADVVIIDDPIKNRKDAESKTIRESVVNEIRASFITRLEPGGSIIILQTRWHPEDPIGVFSKEDGWEHIHMPANTKDDLSGKWLFPERFKPADYLQKRKDLGSYDWNALYMANPRPPEGGIWKRKYMRLESAEQHAGIMRMSHKWNLYYDLAFSEKEAADETVGAEFMEHDGIVYARRPSSVRHDMGDLKQWLSNDIISRGVKNYGVDKAFTQSQFAKDLKKIEALKLVRQDPIAGTTKDKFTNFLPILGRFEAGKTTGISGLIAWQLTSRDRRSHLIDLTVCPMAIECYIDLIQ